MHRGPIIASKVNIAAIFHLWLWAVANLIASIRHYAYTFKLILISNIQLAAVELRSKRMTTIRLHARNRKCHSGLSVRCLPRWTRSDKAFFFASKLSYAWNCVVSIWFLYGSIESDIVSLLCRFVSISGCATYVRIIDSDKEKCDKF